MTASEVVMDDAQRALFESLVEKIFANTLSSDDSSALRDLTLNNQEAFDRCTLVGFLQRTCISPEIAQSEYNSKYKNLPASEILQATDQLAELSSRMPTPKPGVQ
jgi:hypothetical protein